MEKTKFNCSLSQLFANGMIKEMLFFCTPIFFCSESLHVVLLSENLPTFKFLQILSLASSVDKVNELPSNWICINPGIQMLFKETCSFSNFDC